MDPALQELLASGEASDEVEIVVRLQDGAEPPPTLRLVSRFGPVATARIERSSIWQIYGHSSIVSIKAPRWLVSEDDYGPLISVEDAEAIDVEDSDRRRPDGIAQTGRGVVLGVIDWGCDFAHPDFIDEAGQSRLLALWDQRAAVSDTNRYGYGRVLRQPELNAALHSDDPYRSAGYHPARSDTGIGAHGTHVLGIAAGNGRGGGPVGIAPDAGLVFVHLGRRGFERSGPLGDSSQLLDAIHFIVSEAGERPLVINMSIGRHAGPHDGTTLVEQAIDWLLRARAGTAVVQSTGNYFGRDVHCAGRLWSGAINELPFEVRPGDRTPNEVEVWYPGRDVFSASLVSPDGRVVAEAPLGGKSDVAIDGRRVGTLYHRPSDPNNGDHHINLFQYPNAPPGMWKLRLFGEDVTDGRYHAWIERDPSCQVCQAMFDPDEVDRRGTTGSICNSLQTIAVGAYDGHDPEHPVAPFSSSGPTRDGRVRPLLLAPGVRILAARSRSRDGGSPLLTRMSGTSMAAPHVAGTIALMFEAGGRMPIAQTRRALLDALGPVPSDEPQDRDRVGFGVLDIIVAVKHAARLGEPPAPGRIELPSATDPAAAPAPKRSAPRSGPRPTPSPPATLPDAGLPALVSLHDVQAEESAMNPECCGEACETCEHCAEQSCASCPCCHEAAAGQALAGASVDAIAAVETPDTIEAVEMVETAGAGETGIAAEAGAQHRPRAAGRSRAAAPPDRGHPAIQVVPSLFELSEQATAGVLSETGPLPETEVPALEIVPSPLAEDESWPGDADDYDDGYPAVEHDHDAAGAGESGFSRDLQLDEALERTIAAEHTQHTEHTAHGGFPHPVEAAEALVAAGIEDATEFVAESFARTGRHWPGGCTVRSLFDELSGRRPPASPRALVAFDPVGRPGQPLATTLQAGDLIIRRGDGGFASAAILAHPWLYREHEAGAHGLHLESSWPGLYAHVVEPGARPRNGHARLARRICRIDGSVLPNILIVRSRPRGSMESSDAGSLAVGEHDAQAEAAVDPNVRWLQASLNRAIGARLVVDGLYGPATRDAVRRYQSARGLVVDGIAGPRTRAALRAEYGHAPPPQYPRPDDPPPYPPAPRYPPAPAYPPQVYALPAYPPQINVPPGSPPSLPQDYPPPDYHAQPPATAYPPAGEPPMPYQAGGVVVADAPVATGTVAAEDIEAVACRRVDRFGYDSSQLTAAHHAVIADVARALAGGRRQTVSVVGYASPEGSAAYNLALGQRRADAVAAALRDAVERQRRGAAAALRFDVRTEGEARQVSADAAANRRVEICYEQAPVRPPRPQPPRPRPPRPTPPRVLVRHDVASAQGQAMLLRYEEAVRRMMALPASDSRSWTFQWYIHAIRNDRTRAGELTAVFGGAASPARQLAERAWNNCRAHFDAGEILFFLPWHRMYVFFLERICRELLAEPEFTLPYWNYSSGSTVLPARFRDPRSPLFRAARNAGSNQGRRVDDGQPANTLSASRALARPNYATRGNDEGFNEFLDNDPHGTVHVLVGNNSRGMGVVPWAAGDPIFWLHHCNIDRIWASWNAAGRRNPADAAFLDRRFPFADGNGSAVDARVRDFVDIASARYRYDRLETVPAPASSEAWDDDEASRKRRSKTMARRSTVAPRGGIPLGGNAIRINLGRLVGDAEQADEATATKRTYLVLKNIRANVQPGVIYHVYLSLPTGARGQAAQRHHVGPLNFFDAVPMAGHAQHFSGKTRRFDVTALAGRLRAAGLLDESPSVTIAPAGQPASSAQPVIGEISFVEA